MNIKLLKKSEEPSSNISVFLNKDFDYTKYSLTNIHQNFIREEIEKEKKIIQINLYDKQIYIINVDDSKNVLEENRKLGSELCSILNKNKYKSVVILGADEKAEIVLAFIEGIALSNYKFIKYFREPNKNKPTLTLIEVLSSEVNKLQIDELTNIVESVYLARDLANEPFSSLTAVELSKRILDLKSLQGIKVEVFEKSKIEKLKMGGLLAVNKGSVDPPTFSIIEWKPQKHVNKKPYILVGKGIVFDSGGYSIKPTKNSMDIMKFDMAGAAAVVGAMSAISKNKLPIHIIAFIPATDNAVDAKSYVPGDVIEMHNGLFVEVLNTDAEGRLILADALSFAKEYEPELVMDLATLTGSAAAAIGTEAAVVMGTADDKYFELLKRSGEDVYERVVKFPFWDEYKEMIKSKIADIKNIGGKEAGAITAGKFLEYFTDYPWIHIDLAGPAMLNKKSAYRTEGGSGYGVRLLYDFFKKINQ